MREVAILAAVLLVIGSVPITSARHLSVGANGDAGMGPSETPEDKSVNDTEEAIGNTSPAECYEAEAELTADEARSAASSRDFCGELIYNQDAENWQRVSPSDQDFADIPDSVLPQDVAGPVSEWTFDAMPANVAGTFIGYCYVWCPFNTGGDEAWEATHTAGNNAPGVTMHDADEADNHTGDRYQIWGGAYHYPRASDVVQESTNAWRMNGWWHGAGAETFVAYLQDANGLGITDDELQAVVENAKGEYLPENVDPSVCLYTPDANMQIGAEMPPTCEIYYEYSGSSEVPDTDATGEAYTNKCEAPTYFCGLTGGNGGWYGVVLCIPGGYTAPSAVTDACPKPSRKDYSKLHHVVAPTQSPCSGQVEPGFITDSKHAASASHAYLAHDLDVYVPPTAASATNATNGFANTAAWAEENQEALQQEAEDQADALVDEALSALPSAVESTVETVNLDNRIEPNADPTANELADSSQQFTVDRSLEDDSCAPFSPTDETASTVDPWVNYVHSEQWAYAGIGVGDIGPDEETHRDGDNQEKTAYWYSSGHIGMVADNNDRGDDNDQYPYPQAGEDQAGEYENTGHYAMYWDMRVDENGDPNPDASCSLGFAQQNLVEEMVAAGYGPRTGLIQAIYLEEPTEFFRDNLLDRQAYLSPPNVYLTMSQAIKELYKQGDPVVTQELRDLASNFVPVDGPLEENPSVQFPGNDMGMTSDFGQQCVYGPGGWNTNYQFLHNCDVDCSEDTVVTTYMFETTNSDDTLGGDESALSTFAPDGDPVSFPANNDDIVVWHDVDPFSGDADRNAEENAAPCLPDQISGDRLECPEAVDDLEAGTDSTLVFSPVKEDTGLIAADRPGDVDYDIFRNGTHVERIEGATSASDETITWTDSTSSGEQEYGVQPVYEYAVIDAPERVGPVANATAVAG